MTTLLVLEDKHYSIKVSRYTHVYGMKLKVICAVQFGTRYISLDHSEVIYILISYGESPHETEATNQYLI